MLSKWQIRYDQEFINDVRYWKTQVSNLREELQAITEYILEYGEVPEEYNPHLLVDPSLPYNGNMDFHLFDGKLDLLVIYTEIEKKKIFRFIRLGSHKQLFHPYDE
ncbi:type II toxin-antitoxin system YafQ family toxin [Ligilactobacillus equi]|uniref:Addiction module toxin RelE n=1 Tax=Ligilactobacillus equi DSM 15833 = JCM 10991 TaxID=1423740 RepID=A0A0R1THL0_9LACO|nr:type II toxin-antitoxin system YafQ family toxin [Ligilactobacillus equi]KRL79508.1 hypothetical protein FC36_GL000455 [Ligilactobacillus equi DSM 15833 = JCM 10991]